MVASITGEFAKSQTPGTAKGAGFQKECKKQNTKGI
jgi:hypothetical protein